VKDVNNAVSWLQVVAVAVPFNHLIHGVIVQNKLLGTAKGFTLVSRLEIATFSYQTALNVKPNPKSSNQIISP